MNSDLQRDLMDALERPHRLGTIGGDLEEQLAHCASFSSVLAEVAEASGLGIVLGTGGGLPGIALAAVFPDMHWTLVDMRSARADEVERTVLRLGYSDRVEVRACEAQVLGHETDRRESYDVAVARAFGPSSITAECAAGVVAVGGVFIVSEPPEGSNEERWPVAGVEALGFSAATLVEADGHRFAVLRKESAAPTTIPRLPPRSNRGWFG